VHPEVQVVAGVHLDLALHLSGFQGIVGDPAEEGSMEMKTGREDLRLTESGIQNGDLLAAHISDRGEGSQEEDDDQGGRHVSFHAMGFQWGDRSPRGPKKQRALTRFGLRPRFQNRLS
jgi:hypothetical protein